MEIKAGYKQTDIGIIPKDWELKGLGPLCTAINDGTHRTPKYVDDGIPFYSVENVIANSFFDTKHISEKEHNELIRRCKPEKGDILLTRIGAIGATKLIDWNVDASIYVSLALLKVNKELIDNKYLYWYTKSQQFIKGLERDALTNAIPPKINMGNIGKVQIAFPIVREEQTAIAEALSDVDAFIANLEKLIAKKKDIKQGVMQLLLTGKKRLPGFSGEWEVKELGDLFEITSSKRVFQSEWKNEGVPFYRARELAILSEKGSVDNELFISKVMYETYKKAHGVPKIGDVLVTGVGTLGRVYVVSDNHEFYFKDGNIIWFKNSGKVKADFLKQLYLTPLILKQIEDASAGTTVGTYTISNAKKTRIPLPSFPEQSAIAQVLTDMDTEIDELERKLTKHKSIKRGMMQELLTGKKRLI